jgi:uncharacterized protein (TIGR02145 family)
MKTLSTAGCFIFIFIALKANAQNYLISFEGTGATTTVSSVKVENLVSGASLILDGSDILGLTWTVGIPSIGNELSTEIKIYPNPMTENSLFELTPPVAGDATISVYDITGKPVAQIQCFLDKYLHKFHLSGLQSGLYLISIKGSTYRLSGKLLCNGKGDSKIRIEEINSNLPIDEKKAIKNTKGSQATVEMAYHPGDRLKFTGISGNYSMVVTDIPTENKTIQFNFIPCTDGDNNNYPVVKIGTQTWMAENLKTTRYSDGQLIVFDFSISYWAYNNDETNVATYGRLYNRAAIMENKHFICPAGWHAPTIDEWRTLQEYLGGETVAGGKMKETGSSHWDISITVGSDEAGFKALPAGNLMAGTFMGLGKVSQFLSINPDDYSIVGSLHYAFNSYPLLDGPVQSGSYAYGFPVRCLKGVIPTVETNVTLFSGDSAAVGGTVISEGEAPVIERGVYWRRFGDSGTGIKIELGSGTGSFHTVLYGIVPKNYYVRAYVKSNAGTSYGNEVNF